MIRNDKIQILVKMGQTDDFFLRSEESLKYSKGLVIDTFTNFYCAPTVVICVINNYIKLYIASSVRSVVRDKNTGICKCLNIVLYDSWNKYSF